MPAALTLDALTKRYGEGAPVIDGLSHTFRPGTATGLVGPNGSGKTTLLRLLSAAAFPTSGAVRYGELDVHARPYAYLRHVGIVHAAAALPEYLTAEELLEWILRERGTWDEAAPERIDALLTRLRLDERRRTLIGTYSSGMVQKTQIAAALIHVPDVVIMDEPFRSLDAASTEATHALLRSVTARGGLLLLASHAAASLEALADGYVSLRRPATGPPPAAVSPDPSS